MTIREPFAYESNVFKIRQLLVPDPIPLAGWEVLVEDWRRNRHRHSLLEWIIHSGVLPESLLLGTLAGHLGVDWIPGGFAGPRPMDGEEHLLVSHGFILLGKQEAYRLVGGGPEFCPDLQGLLGPSHRQWKWVLVSPLRGPLPANPFTVAEDDPVPNRYAALDWLQELIQSWWAEGASDLHFETSGNFLTVRAHIHGSMRSLGEWDGDRASIIPRLLETVSGLTGRDRSIPADGTARLSPENQGFSPRISFLPTACGQSIVLRMPARKAAFNELKDLGMPASMAGQLKETTLLDPGLILFTGTTGSGKTTTLYTLLHELAEANLKVLTIEDPVEQELPFAVQSAVDEPNGWTFDKAIRSFLRQDPDLIMVGELRDAASAQAACRAALTGHAVLATLHAGSCDGAVKRLSTYGIPQGLLQDALRAVVFQRMLPHEAGCRPAFEMEACSS